MGNTSDVVVESARQGDTPGADTDVVAGAAVDHGRRHRLGSGDGHLGAGVAVTSEAAAIMGMIERAARDPAVDIEKLERLMAMRERIETRNAERSFNAAVAAAKGEIGPIFKNKTVDFTSAKGRTNYRYEDFAGVARAVDPVFARYGLSYRYRSKQEGPSISVTCVLSHADGHSEATSLEAKEDQSGNKNSIQSIGSAATYLQRYTLKLALGLSASTDDDGRAAGQQKEAISEDQAQAIADAITAKGKSHEGFCKLFKIERVDDLPAARFDEAMIAIRGKAKVVA